MTEADSSESAGSEKLVDDYEFLDFNNGGLFVQWKCDLHEECTFAVGDSDFCPCGSTIMILTESSLLKWPVENPESGDVCDCDDDFCEHAIDIKKDYDKLEEGLIVNAMWPFEGNHFYAGRILRLKKTEYYPKAKEREAMRKLQFYKNRKQSVKSQKDKFKNFTSDHYYGFDPKSLSIHMNPESLRAKESNKLIKVEKENIRKRKGSDATFEHIMKISRMNEQIKWLRNELNKTS